MKIIGNLLKFVLVAGLGSAVFVIASESGSDLLQKGLAEERAKGDCRAAIKLYERVVKEYSNERKLAAEAWFRIAECEQALNLPESRNHFELVVKQYAADQPDVAERARARLSVGETASPTTAFRRIWSGADAPTTAAISPDGQNIAFWKGKDLVLHNLIRGETRVLVTNAPNAPDDSRFIVWSSDSRTLAYHGKGQINVINSDGSGSRTVVRYDEETFAAVHAWSPDKTRLLVATLDNSNSLWKIVWVNAVDGTAQPIRNWAGALRGAMHLSPDGRYIVFAGSDPNRKESSENRLFLIAINGGGQTRLSDDFPVGWSPDGKFILSTRYRATGGAVGLWKIPFANGKAEGLPLAVTTDFQADRVQFLGLTRGGTLYYSRETGRSDIYTAAMNPVTGKVTSLPEAIPVSRTGYNVLPRWSPDGRRILYYQLPRTPRETRTRELSIYSFDTKKDQRVPIASFGGGATCWTSDGASILINETNGISPGEHYSPVHFDLTTQKATLLFESDESSFTVSCIDGMVVTADQSSIRVRDLRKGSDLTIYSGRVAGGANLSHDGRSVFFRSPLDPATSGIFVVSTAGGPVRELRRDPTANLQENYGAAWSPDDRFIYILRKADRTADYELLRVPAAGGTEESTGLKLPDLRDIDISPDGTRIAFSLGAVIYPEIWAMEFLPPARERSVR